MAEYSIYPTAIDGYSQLPLVVDNVSRVDAVTVNRLRSAIINIENELGVDPSGLSYETVRARLDALEDILETITVGGTDLLGYKNPVRVATTQNISNLVGGAPSTLDGLTLEENDRILVYQQNDQSENGIYEVMTLGTGSNGTWIRAADANSIDNLIPGSEVFVMEGDSNSLTKFWLVTPGPYVLETTSLEFVEGLYIMKSDSSPTSILSATAIGSAFNSASATSSISVRGYKEIDFAFAVTNLGSISEIRARVLYSLKASPGTYAATPSDWNILLAEDIVSGIATVDPYTLSLNSATYPGLTSLPGSFAFRAPVSGLHMMVLIWAESGSPSGSSFVGSTLRRV